jgi:hypothetical protein
MSDYLQYWKYPYNVGDNDQLNHTAGDQLGRLSPGDVVWVVTIKTSHLYLLGRLAVGKLVGQRAAEKLLGTPDLWRARYHVIARPGTIDPVTEIDLHGVARLLRFLGNVDRLPLPYSGRSLQSLRTLAPESATLLQNIWARGGGPPLNRYRSRQPLKHSEGRWHARPPLRIWETFDHTRKPGTRRVGTVLASPEEIAQSNEQANQRHYQLLTRLSSHLSKHRWNNLRQIAGGVDLAATHCGVRIFFEAKTITSKNENHQVRLGIGQLLEYRFKYGTGRVKLCLITDQAISQERAEFVDSLNIGWISPHRVRYRGNATARKLIPDLIQTV